MSGSVASIISNTKTLIQTTASNSYFLLDVADTGGLSGGSSITGVAVDNDNNIYTTGYAVNAALTGSETSLIKYDKDGNLLWQRRISGTSANPQSTVAGITIDKNSQSVFIYHQYYDATGTGYLTGIAKYSPLGVLTFQRSFTRGTASTSNDNPYSISCDAQGQLLVTGSHYDQTLAHTFGFIAKCTTTGTFLWHKYLSDYDPNANDCISNCSAYDQFGDVYVGGSGRGVDANWIPFLKKYNAAGTLQWQININNELLGTATDGGEVSSITISNNNILYIAGYFNKNYLGARELFLAKLDIQGNLLSYKKYLPDETGPNISLVPNTYPTGANASKLDLYNNLYIIAIYRDSFYNVKTMVIKFDSDLNFIFANKSEPFYSNFQCIDIDSNNNLIIGGNKFSVGGSTQQLLLKVKSNGNNRQTIVGTNTSVRISAASIIPSDGTLTTYSMSWADTTGSHTNAAGALGTGTPALTPTKIVI